jgi:hypothetical protein
MFNHGMKFKETHTLQSFLYDNIAAGRHLEWDKPNSYSGGRKRRLENIKGFDDKT